MNSLRDAIKLVRAGHSTPELRRYLWGIGAGIAILAVHLVAKVLIHGFVAGLHVSFFDVYLGLWIGLMVMWWRRAAIIEAFDAARDKRLCTRCLYPLPTETTICPECGLDTATAQPPRPYGRAFGR
jgi:hypothetical protein